MSAGRRDAILLLTARSLRLLSYGFLSVILALYLAGLGLSVAQIGTLLTVALIGGAVTTALVSATVGWLGVRRALIAWSALLAVGGVVLAASRAYPALLVVATLGVLSPSGQDVGPFLSLEQAALAGAGPRVRLYAWYNLVGYVAVAFGGLVVATAIPALQRSGLSLLDAQRALVWSFAAMGVVLVFPYALLSPGVEVRTRTGGNKAGLRESRRILMRLSGLFALDALAGGLIVQSLVAYWFTQRFGIGLATLGPLFFGTNLMSGISFMISAPLAERIGLLPTMVFTHLPSNILLAAVPFMPTWQSAGAVLLARHLLSQMDVPPRQAYTMAMVVPEERASAAGFTNGVRTAAASIAPAISGAALATVASGLPFVLAGGLKAVYDLALWLTFRRVPMPDADAGSRSRS